MTMTDPKVAPLASHPPHHKQTNHDPSALKLRPPAVPLVAVDPYFSCWSFSTQLTDEFPRHWTGMSHSMTGLVRIDGKPYRFMGPQPEDVKAIKQTRLEVCPTRTRYEFQTDKVALELIFTTPCLPYHLDTFSWPVTYVTFNTRSLDGKSHKVEMYYDLCAEFVVDSVDQPVVWSRLKVDGARMLSFGSATQRVLEKAGDNRRIDWGYVYLVLPKPLGGQDVMGVKQEVQVEFARTGQFTESDDLEMPATCMSKWPGLSCSFDLSVQPTGANSQFIMLAYDDLFSVEYFHRKLRPYWNRNNMGFGTMIKAALADYPKMMERCAAFDDELMADCTAAGGEHYAQLCALSYRQTIASHKLVADLDGTPLYFSKENFSNGCIATVDVTYPSAPFFLLFNPHLLGAQLTPILDYANLPRWRFPFAPHDLGTYPHANGQVYGGGEKTEKDQVPVEECGNMLLLLAALTRAEGHTQYVTRYWPLISKWAGYLKDKGFDPEKQLCTDDFAGRLAHNTNLSIKAILALGAYAQLCDLTGHADVAKQYRRVAEEMTAAWVEHADDGDHYRLAFDRPGTWSQKYNLVWDRILNLNLFPAEVFAKELAFYKTKQTRYGLPLDNRKAYTKLDWIVWTAFLADDLDGFKEFVEPLHHWAHNTPTRVPLTDWYWTHNGKQAPGTPGTWSGFQARSVVGGIYIQLLKFPGFWRKYLDRVGPVKP